MQQANIMLSLTLIDCKRAEVPAQGNGLTEAQARCGRPCEHEESSAPPSVMTHEVNG